MHYSKFNIKNLETSLNQRKEELEGSKREVSGLKSRTKDLEDQLKLQRVKYEELSNGKAEAVSNQVRGNTLF